MRVKEKGEREREKQRENNEEREKTLDSMLKKPCKGWMKRN